MATHETRYSYVLDTRGLPKAGGCAVTVAVERHGGEMLFDCDIGFDRDMPVREKAYGILAAVKELQEMVLLTIAVMDSGISTDDLLGDFGGI